MCVGGQVTLNSFETLHRLQHLAFNFSAQEGRVSVFPLAATPYRVGHG